MDTFEEINKELDELKGFYDRLYNTHMKCIERNAALRTENRELRERLGEEEL